jgi:AcrR family transcriptional regulator
MWPARVGRLLIQASKREQAMGRSEEKQNTHKRIIEEAARKFRAEGIHAVSIAELMGRLGLTHGGFYAHFPTKDALSAEACTEGFAQTQDRLLTAARNAPAGEELAAIIDSYLSVQHRDNPALGCVIPSLGAEIARDPQEVRTAFTQAFQEMLTRLAPFLAEGPSEEQEDTALALIAGMVGTILLARAVNDSALSDRLLHANRVFYQQLERPAEHHVEQPQKAEMRGDAVVELMQLFDWYGIEVFVDGGWGVDALLGEQTRPHGDLDIALQHQDVPKLRALLEARGYKDVPRDDTRDCNFVMGDDQGHEIDFHSYTFDAQGKLTFGVAYPLESLTGHGSIQGYPVKCISVEWMVKFHSGYQLDEDDYHDVSALCERFAIALPAEYERFTKRG